MKRNHTLRALSLLIAALVLLLPVSAFAGESAAEPDGGVAWDTTVDGMIEIEGVDEAPAGSVTGDFVTYGFLHETDMQYPTFLLYVFKGDALAVYGGSVSAFFMDEGADMAALFDEYLAVLTETWGEPTLTDMQRVTDSFNAVQEGSLPEEYVVSYIGWDLGGGFALHLLHFDYETDENIFYQYMNETVLFDGGA